MDSNLIGTLVISSLLKQEDLSTIFIYDLHPDFFQNTLQNKNKTVFLWLVNQFKAGQKVPPQISTFKQFFPDFKLEAATDSFDYYVELLKNAYKHEIALQTTRELQDLVVSQDVPSKVSSLLSKATKQLDRVAPLW